VVKQGFDHRFIESEKLGVCAQLNYLGNKCWCSPDSTTRYTFEVVQNYVDTKSINYIISLNVYIP